MSFKPTIPFWNALANRPVVEVVRGCERSEGVPEANTPEVRYKNRPFQVSLDVSFGAGFEKVRVTPDGGLILVRELDERLGFRELIKQYLVNPRRKNAVLICRLAPGTTLT